MNTKNQKLEELKLGNTSQSSSYNKLTEEILALCRYLNLSDDRRTIDHISRLWIPLALELAQIRCQSDNTLIVGILGSQGMGKTTLCMVLSLIFNTLDLAVASLSLDDLYLTHAARKKLQQQDSRLIWRGPPGTHDIKLGLQVIEECLEHNVQSVIELPRFDKSAFNGSGDRTTSETITKPDILLFEGWFVGVQPIPKSCFDNPPSPIMTIEDIDFAQDSNLRLRDYLPLWDKLDRLIVLDPEDYHLSKKWRQEAEQKMIALGKTGMNDQECDRFVEYFWKALHPELFIKPLTKTADWVIEVKKDRSLGKIHVHHNPTNL